MNSVWAQVYSIWGQGLAVSAAVAFLPTVLLLFLLGIKRKAAWVAGLWGLGSTLIVAIAGYHMPVSLAFSAAGFGVAFRLFPISWIVLWAIVLYDLTVATGKFAIVKDSIGALTPDLRIQSIVIAFGFGAFIEGATGFGTPVAVAGAMMVGLGFSAYNAAALCLLANTAPVAFGAIGVPIIALAGITGLPLDNLSGAVGTLCSPIAVILPAYMIVAMGGFISALEVWPALLVAGLTFGVVEYLVSNFINVQLTVILSAITSMAAVIALLKVWRPRSPRLGKRNAGTEATALDPFEAFATDATPVPAKLNHTYGQILWLDAVYHPGRSRSSLGIQALPSRFGCGNLHVALAGSS